ncbi:hypothetical protein BRYFOR_09448 [Marvinbryantia formatexigens DSM 14469]|uniref:Uncharacterized protein n=1 Tax=Marvinbryantia formatexigens DSM 14469 TaxID=478749 RepID=C6LLA1_9FIRM|nr:hypothetical protein BRYFOR_09448 [Marvinbryantia formatexigens DSM 14469]
MYTFPPNVACLYRHRQHSRQCQSQTYPPCHHTFENCCFFHFSFPLPVLLSAYQKILTFQMKISYKFLTRLLLM